MFHGYGVVAAAATLLVAAGVGNAQTLAPVQSQSVALGPVSGGVYYTVAPEGDRVVATLQCSTPPCIVRMIATLTPGQSVTLSTPRGVGQPPMTAYIARRGDEILFANRDQMLATKAPLMATAR